MWLQELLYWGVKVNQRGCLKCSNSHLELPRDTMSLLPKARYNHSVREKFIADQIVNAMKGYTEHKSFIGFYPKHLIYGILKNLNQNLEESGPIASAKKVQHRTTEQEEELFKSFLSISKERTTFRPSNETLKKEFNEKVSMLYYLMSHSDRKM